MKKKLLMCMIFVVLCVGNVALAASENVQALLNKELEITYDGYILEFKDANRNDVHPISYDGTTYLPIRAISRVFNSGISWDGKTNTIILGSGEIDNNALEVRSDFLKGTNANIEVLRNEEIKIIYKNKEQTFEDATGKRVYPLSYNGSTYLPVRAISNLYEETIAWDAKSNSVKIGNTESLFKFDSSTGTITGVNNKYITEAVIPEEILGIKVTTIGQYAFTGYSDLKTIPNSVITFEEGAFPNCKKLENVIVPNSVTTIEDGAFFECIGLKNITISNSVTSIGNYTFYNCKSLKNITIPNSVTSIGFYAFSDCENLGNVKIPNSVTSIENNTFYNCKSLKNITIPNSVTSIGFDAFYGCENLENVKIPNSVTSIGDYTFCNCKSLKNVTIPNSVTYIGSYTFYNCKSLKNITIPNSVTYISFSVFSGCENLENVKIPNSVTSIWFSAFSNCSKLKNITIPDSVAYIGEDAFSGCNRENITLPSHITNIDEIF